MTVNEQILNGSISHMVWLERYKTRQVRQILSLLNKAEADVIEQLSIRLSKISERGIDLGPDTTKRLNEISKYLDTTHKELSAVLFASLNDELQDFAVYEADFQARLIENAVAPYVAIDLKRPGINQLKAIVTKQPFQGRLLKSWFSDLTADQKTKINTTIRLGLTEGQTTDQIIRRIRGTKARQYRDGALEITRHHAESITRTAIAHVSDRASNDMWMGNADIIKGLKYVATLDGRTSAICRSRDNKVYALGKSPYLPAHFNCRSRVVPYLGETSIKGTRASEIGQVPQDLKYGDWLKKQPKATQEDVLGVSKAKLFREGGLSIDKFSDSTGKAYTLNDLRNRDRGAFDKVFGGHTADSISQRVSQEEGLKKYLGAKTYEKLQKNANEAINISGNSLHKMSEAELVAIHAYTDGNGYYKRLNTALRSDDAVAIARVSPLANVLDNALQKIPPYEGMTIRRTNLPESIASDMIKGKSFNDLAFMSSSKKDLGDAFGGNHKFVISSSKGREINGYSAYSREFEVLFPRETKFKIIDVEKKDDGITTIIMKDDEG